MGPPEGTIPKGAMFLGVLVIDPTVAVLIASDESGWWWYNSTDNSLKFWDGTRILETVGYRWDDLRVPLTSAKTPAANSPDMETFKGGIKVPAFDKTTEQSLFFEVQLPHPWKEGTNIIPHIHWSPSDTDTGFVRWGLEYTIANIDGTFGNAVTLTIDDAGDGTSHKHQVVGWSEIDMTGFLISTILACRVYRDATNDNYNDDAFGLEVDFHYQKDAWGSRQEFIK